MQLAEWKAWLQQRMQPLIRRSSQKIKQYVQVSTNWINNNKKKTVMAAATLVLGGTSVASASYYYTSNVTPIYHVVLNGKEIGIVNDPNVINQWAEKRLKEEQEKHNGIQLKLSDFITFTEEKVFNGKFDNEAAIKALEREADIKVEAVKLVINGVTVGYAANKQAAEKMLEKLKEKYSGASKSKGVTAASADTDREVKEVKFKEQILIEKGTVTAAQVLTEDKLEELLTKGTYKQVIHTVQEGDCISCIASKYGITSKDIYANNPGLTEDSLLQLGDQLNVTAIRPLVTVQVVEEVEKDETIHYSQETRSNNKLPKGETRVIQNGKEGKKRVRFQVVKENGQVLETKLIQQETITEPIPMIIEKGTKVIPSRGTGRLSWPARGYISSGFGMRWGRMHEGIDIAGSGSIRAADNGKVVSAGWKGDYGNAIIIDHGNGMRTLYGHLRSINVKVGEVVSQGKVIGVMGSTGDSTGVHLHFEVLKNGVAKNPMLYLGR